MPTDLGHSTGRWNGDVLVVETEAFLGHRSGNGFGIPSSPDKRLVESFRLHDDGSRLLYRFELTDPVYLTETLSGETEWIYGRTSSIRRARATSRMRGGS